MKDYCPGDYLQYTVLFYHIYPVSKNSKSYHPQCKLILYLIETVFFELNDPQLRITNYNQAII